MQFLLWVAKLWKVCSRKADVNLLNTSLMLSGSRLLAILTLFRICIASAALCETARDSLVSFQSQTLFKAYIYTLTLAPAPPVNGPAPMFWTCAQPFLPRLFQIATTLLPYANPAVKHPPPSFLVQPAVQPPQDRVLRGWRQLLRVSNPSPTSSLRCMSHGFLYSDMYLSAFRSYPAATDNQPTFLTQVFEGEHSFTRNNNPTTTCIFNDLLPLPVAL